jgi:hypothetical protein
LQPLTSHQRWMPRTDFVPWLAQAIAKTYAQYPDFDLVQAFQFLLETKIICQLHQGKIAHE